MGEEGGAGAGEDCGPQLGAGVLPASVLDTHPSTVGFKLHYTYFATIKIELTPRSL